MVAFINAKSVPKILSIKDNVLPAVWWVSDRVCPAKLAVYPAEIAAFTAAPGKLH
jgi:hypothetical protein